MSYQQVFYCFKKLEKPVEFLYTGLHNPAVPGFFVVLRHRSLPRFLVTFLFEKVYIL